MPASVGVKEYKGYTAANSTTTDAKTTQATGSTFVVFTFSEGSNAPSTISDSKSNTYSEITGCRVNANWGYGAVKSRAFICEDGTGGANHTWTASANNGYTSIMVCEVLDSDTADGEQEANAQHDTSSPFTDGQITTTEPDCLILACYPSDSNSNINASVGGGFSIELQEGNGSSVWPMALASRSVTSTGTYGASWTESGVSESSPQIVAIKSAAGGTTVSAAHTENVDLSSTFGAVATRTGSLTASMELTSTLAGILGTQQSIDAAVDFGDAWTSQILLLGSISAPVELSDAQTSVLTAAGAISAAVEAGDTCAAVATVIAAVTDTVEFADSWAGVLPGVAAALSADVTLASAFADALTARAQLSGQVDLADIQAAIVQTSAAIAGVLELAETQLGSSLGISGEILANVEFSDAEAAALIAAADIVGPVDFAAVHTATLQAQSSIAEPLELADVQQAFIQTGVSWSAALDLAELWVATAGEIAAAVQILVAARDRRIVAKPRDSRIVVKRRNRRISVKKLN